MLNVMGNLLNSVGRTMARRRELRRAFAELSALDDRSLADIGISRSEIRYVLTHNPRPTAAAAAQAPVRNGVAHAA
jgi:uncharacterized protein YjiS (DUF1127 family)